MNVATKRYRIDAKWKGVRFTFYWEGIDHGTVGRGAFLKAVDVMRQIYRGFFSVRQAEIMRNLELTVTELQPLPQRVP